MLQQIINIPERLVGALDQSQTDLVCTIAFNWASFCKVCFDQLCPTSKLSHASSLETFVHTCSKMLFNQTCRHLNNGKAENARYQFIASDGHPEVQATENPFNWTAWQLSATQARIRCSLCTIKENIGRSQAWPDSTSPGKLEIKATMACTTTQKYLMGDTSLDSCISIAEVEGAAVFPADVKSAEELHLNAFDVVTTFKKMNGIVHICV